jgi:hypothetical protein
MNSGRGNPEQILATALEPVVEGLLHDGVAVLPALVPSDRCAAARAAIDDHRGITEDRATWYRHEPAENGIVPVHQHPSFWDIRQLPEVYSVFRALLGTPFLWVSMDRGSFKPPYRPDHPDWADNSPFHWDVDPRESTRRLQGMVYLTDCDADQGAFQCVPDIYRNPDPWWSIHGLEPFAEQRIRSDGIHRIGAPAGSLIVWDARLPHGSGVNRAADPRYALYMTMYREGSEARRAQRVADFDARRAPAWWRDVPGQMDPEPEPGATLSPLGEQLLGRTPW